ncbi:MAG TPA: polynucleotide adenylyltransferase [Syntrophomonadaceae bacterium]|nr:polynucleotide adenylyltransferase [Syntrophomonadaceae bacterium]
MNIIIPENVQLLMTNLNQGGYQAYVYGACLRDLLLGKQPLNWDVSTDALPTDVLLLFDEKDGYSAIPDDHDYRSVRVIFQGESCKISTFQTAEETRFSGDIKEDLLHHDFTMNSIAYNNQQGIVDPFHGVQDIQKQMIRCAGNPFERLQEDPVRILRAVRFEAQLGFYMDEKLLDAISSSINTLPTSHSTQVCNELTQILLTQKPSFGINRLLELGLLRCLIPELIPTVGFDTHSSYHDRDVFKHTMVVLDQAKAGLNLRLAALFHDIDKPNCLTIDEDGEGHCYGHANSSSEVADSVLSRLGFDRKTIYSVKAIVKEHMNCYDNISELSIRRLIRRVGLENLDSLFELQIADACGSARSGRNVDRVLAIRSKCWEMVARREPLSTHDLDIHGYDLMGLGYPPGKEIGQALEYLLDKVIDNPTLNHKETLMELLKSKD